MGPVVIVENEPFSQPTNAVHYVLIILGVDVLVFHRTPESLTEDVVEDFTLTVHADAHLTLVGACR